MPPIARSTYLSRTLLDAARAGTLSVPALAAINAGLRDQSAYQSVGALRLEEVADLLE